MITLKTVIVDIDGTLINSQKRKDKFYSLAINKLNKQYGHKYPFSLRALLKKRDLLFRSYPDGRRNDPELLLKDFLLRYKLPKDEFESLLIRLMELYWDNLENSPIIEGASDFLYDLVQNGFNYILYSDGTSKETEFKLNLFPNNFLPLPYLIIVSDCRECSNQNIVPLGMNKNVETYKFLKNQYNAIAMVGNSEEFDIIPALKAGIYAFNVKKLTFKAIMKELLKIKS